MELREEEREYNKKEEELRNRSPGTTYYPILICYNIYSFR